jgi:DNA-directed RNA polymerase subunit RPC12/RpoP
MAETKTDEKTKVKDPTACANCGSKRVFDPSSQSLVCEHCRSSTVISPNSIGDKKNRYYDGVEIAVEQSEFAQYKCEQCGNINTYFGESEIKRCPSCGSYDRLTKIQKNISHIDGIIPFKITQAQAGAKLKEWIKTRKMTPNNFKQLCATGKTMGLYFPAYVFDASGSYSYHGTIQYSQTIHLSDGTTRVDTYTRPFSGQKSWTRYNYIVSASHTITDDTIKSLKDFNVDSLVKYELPFVAGFPTNEADISVTSANANFHRYLQRDFEREARSNASGGSVVSLSLTHHTHSETYQMALLPIWVTYYTYKNKNFNCYINGHSGLVAGKHPKSFWKIIRSMYDSVYSPKS